MRHSEGAPTHCEGPLRHSEGALRLDGVPLRHSEVSRGPPRLLLTPFETRFGFCNRVNSRAEISHGTVRDFAALVGVRLGAPGVPFCGLGVLSGAFLVLILKEM